jgi:hypothetical protein
MAESRSDLQRLHPLLQALLVVVEPINMATHALHRRQLATPPLMHVLDIEQRRLQPAIQSNAGGLAVDCRRRECESPSGKSNQLVRCVLSSQLITTSTAAREYLVHGEIGCAQ